MPLPPVASAPITMQPMEGAVSVSPSQHQQLQPQQQAQPQQYYSLRSRSSRCSTPGSPVPLLDLTILTIRIITLIRTDTLTTDKSSLPPADVYTCLYC